MVDTHAFRLRGGSVWPAAGIHQPVPDELAPRTVELYVCPREHHFEVPLAADVTEAEIPLVWRCPRHGVESKRMGYETIEIPPAPYRDRCRGDDGRTHYDRLLERRSRLDLDVLLRERLRKMGCTQIDQLPTPAARRAVGSRK
jgi:hypothetical protein